MGNNKAPGTDNTQSKLLNMVEENYRRELRKY
jgi:hypothetical protein